MQPALRPEDGERKWRDRRETASPMSDSWPGGYVRAGKKTNGREMGRLRQKNLQNLRGPDPDRNIGTSTASSLVRLRQGQSQ
jgi:hypothetical protein